MDKGYFIVIEGPDGVGKGTQAELLRQYFINAGRKAFVTDERKYISFVSSKIADALSGKIKIDPYELNKLFAEHRGEYLDKYIRPTLNDGGIVVADRYFYSSFAYGSLDCDLESIIDLNKDFPEPDLTILLLASSEVCINRLKKSKGDNLELYEKKEKLEKIIDNYRKLLDRYPDIKLVDGERSANEVHQEIISLLPEDLKV